MYLFSRDPFSSVSYNKRKSELQNKLIQVNCKSSIRFGP